MQQETFHWPHKDLLDVDQLTQEELFHLLDTAANLHEINSRPVKKVPILKGKSVVLFFAEPSTRTKTSFDMAGKRLSADTFGLAKSGSSLQKGESMKDTALTLQAMNPDVIVIRHSSSGAAQFLAERLHCGVVNAGDGWHAHPTQALLDAFSLRQVWGHDRNAFKDKNLLILGDCAHSRVCRSNVLLLTKLGVNVSLCAPRTLLPAGVDNWPVTVYTDSKKAVRDMDAVMCLRLQLERQQAGLLPDLREYSKRFCLTTAHMELARPGAHIMHPGPILRGLDVSDALADSSQSLILDQVSAGVSVRMAVLYLLATRPTSRTTSNNGDRRCPLFLSKTPAIWATPWTCSSSTARCSPSALPSMPPPTPKSWMPPEKSCSRALLMCIPTCASPVMNGRKP